MHEKKTIFVVNITWACFLLIEVIIFIMTNGIYS